MRFSLLQSLRRRLVSTELTFVALVVFAVVCVALVLAYEAYAAGRSSRATAEHAATHYASVAAWEFARNASRTLLLTADATIAVPVEHAIRGTGKPVPTLASVAKIARQQERPKCNCPGPIEATTFLRLGYNGIPNEVDGPLQSPNELAELRDLISRALADSLGNLRHTGIVCDLLLYAPPGGEPRVVSVVLDKAPSEQLLAAYVAESPISALSSVLATMVGGVDLLPPTLLPRASQRSAIALTADVAGQSVYAQGRVPPVSIATDSVGSAAPRLVVRAGLTPDGARRMLIASPRSPQLPVLLALVLLAVILLGVALSQIARGAELERMRSDFIASVSHELQTPLALVSVYAEMLLEEHTPAEREYVGFLQVIQRETRRLTQLVQNILRFSEIERGAAHLHIVPMSLGSVLRAAAADFEPLVNSRSARLVINTSDGCRADVAKIDENALRQMLFNILGNALKYGPEGQQITLALRCDGRVAHLLVDDEGPGIPRRHRRRAFARYTRFGDVERQAIAGAGIGLSIVRELAQAQGIRVSLDDAPRGGLRVHLRIPLQVALAEQTPREGSPQPAWSPGAGEFAEHQPSERGIVRTRA